MIHIGVVADKRREDMGLALMDQVHASILSVDDSTLGCTGNHAQVWRQLAKNPAEWNLVLEDDAVPVPDFRVQLAAALDVAPAPIVSLYLGRGYIEDPRTHHLLELADEVGAHWLVAHGRILHAVALAVRGELAADLVDSIQKDRPIDRSLSMWARRRGIEVAYSIPSLVDHAEVPSLVTRYHRIERKAWRIGSRNDWCGEMIRMV